MTPRREAARLDREILAFIAANRRDGRRFNELALRLFREQYRENRAYRRYCAEAGVSPEIIDDWRLIPAVPAEGFRHLRLTTFPRERTRKVFRTSGTTSDRRGEHHFKRLVFYDAAIRAPFKAHFLPDRERMPLFILVEPPSARAESSLSWMMGRVSARFGVRSSGGFYVKDSRLLADRLAGDLRRVRRPVALLATALSLLAFLEWLAGRGLRLRLPRGSRLMETGGFKGQERRVGRRALYRMAHRWLGIPASRCVAEYGMTELSSQCYDSNRGKRRWKEAPPWLGWVVRDPATGRPQPDGREGLLCFYDLANRDSVLAVQTQDVGVARGQRFELVGRASGSPLRGCSLDHEALVRAGRIP